VTTLPSSFSIDNVIARIDLAVTASDHDAICQQIKTALQEATRDGRLTLDEAMVTPVEDGYGRHLLHRDPEDRYTVVVMCWGPGQGTPIHDHAGMWCVECVVQGKIRVDSYRLIEEPGGDRVRFEKEADVIAGVGEAGALIPPFEYHVIENPFDEVAVTMHVYGGEMEFCHIFRPEEEGSDCYRRETKGLSYTA